MQIKFVRSGGFAGMATNVAGTVQFDENAAHVTGEATDYHRELAPQEAEQLRLAADPKTLARTKAGPATPGVVRDGYQYDITVVTKDGKSHSFTVAEGSEEQLRKVAPGAAPLSSWVQKEAQKIWSHRVSSRK